MTPVEAYVGARVYIRTSRPQAFAEDGTHHVIRYGTITKVCSEHDGVLVQPDGSSESYGWGFDELVLMEPNVQRISIWQRLLALRAV